MLDLSLRECRRMKGAGIDWNLRIFSTLFLRDPHRLRVPVALHVHVLEVTAECKTSMVQCAKRACWDIFGGFITHMSLQCILSVAF